MTQTFAILELTEALNNDGTVRHLAPYSKGSFMTWSNKIFLGVISAVALFIGFGVLHTNAAFQSPTELCSRPEVVTAYKKVLNKLRGDSGDGDLLNLLRPNFKQDISIVGGRALTTPNVFKCIANIMETDSDLSARSQSDTHVFKLEMMDNGRFLITADPNGSIN